MSSLAVIDVRFEHYHPKNTLGVHELKPRISWNFATEIPGFKQEEYKIELSCLAGDRVIKSRSATITLPYPSSAPLDEKTACSAEHHDAIGRKMKLRPKGKKKSPAMRLYAPGRP
ncbi:hypothetical protein BJX63DRAFT_438261 [Aspergillus granulosus]|uniref:Uncharacterized protein n=1 Tax=Aspergillus granulosus TaxID=176169 RepID=A0ABR4GSH5_9EURO